MYTPRKMESKIKSNWNWDESPRVDNNIKAVAISVWFILFFLNYTVQYNVDVHDAMAYSISHKLYIII